jgi:hypothetical protein
LFWKLIIQGKMCNTHGPKSRQKVIELHEMKKLAEYSVRLQMGIPQVPSAGSFFDEPRTEEGEQSQDDECESRTRSAAKPKAIGTIDRFARAVHHVEDYLQPPNAERKRG